MQPDEKIKDELLKRFYKMRERCNNKNHANYHRYGGRGIKVIFPDFQSFYEWAIKAGYKKSLQIDRIDNNGNYEPSNCRWVTSKINSRNKQNSIFLEYCGQVKLLVEWAEILEIDPNVVHFRLKQGYSVEDSLEYPVGHITKKLAKKKLFATI